MPHQSLVANLSQTTCRCLSAGVRFFHLDFNGVDDLFSALLVAGCKAARQNALQHDVGCDEAVYIKETTAVVADTSLRPESLPSSL